MKERRHIFCPLWLGALLLILLVDLLFLFLEARYWGVMILPVALKSAAAAIPLVLVLCLLAQWGKLNSSLGRLPRVLYMVCVIAITFLMALAESWGPRIASRLLFPITLLLGFASVGEWLQWHLSEKHRREKRRSLPHP